MEKGFRLESHSAVERLAHALLQEARETRTPLTEKQHTFHLNYAYLKTEALQKRGVTTETMHSTVKDGVRVWSPEREALHRELVSKFINSWADVPANREAMVSGGLAGGGKTTILTHHTPYNLADYAFVSPDDVKVAMAEMGMFPKVNGLTPMEVAAVSYEEATHLTRLLFNDCLERGRNLVFDTTLGSVTSAGEKLVPMREHGYTMSGVFVDILPATSLRRSQERHRQGLNRYVLGECENGGRLLPRDAVKAQVLPANSEHSSKNRLVFNHFRDAGWFKETFVFDNNTDGCHPKLVSHS